MSFVPKLVRLGEGGEENPDDWSMTTSLSWSGTFRGDVGRIRIPASASKPFETDLASVPRPLTWLVPRYGLYTKAAILHDYLCQELKDATIEVYLSRRTAAKRGAPPNETRMDHLADRSDADEIFRLAMTDLGVPFGRRWLIWSAVSWATLLTSLRAGRSTKPAALRWIGLAIVVVAAVLAGFLFVWSSAAGSIVGGGGWFRISVAVLVVPLVGATAGAAAVLPGGYVAQGRWDRALEYAGALLVTVVALPVLAIAGVVAIIALLYRPLFEDAPRVIRDASSRSPATRARLRTRPPPAKRSARSLRIEAVRES